MSAAALPADEAERLEQLRALLVLDTAPEPLFDELARMAAELCGTPAALLSLVDAERQWFKASIGLGGPRETPREHAFCAHAILHEQVMEVPDATVDPRFADSPLVTQDPAIRFYAGAPLQMPDGARIGTLCAVDFQARRLTAQQSAELARLARLAVQGLVMRRELLLRALSVRSDYEDALARRENFLRLIADNLPVRISYIDRERRYQFVNRAQAELFELPREQVLGHSRSELLKRDPDPEVLRHVQAALDGQAQHFEFEEEVHGMWRRIESQLIPDLAPDGTVRGIFTTGVDITERAATERMLLRQSATLRSVAELIPAMLAVVGPDGRYRFVNETFARWHGVTREQAIGSTLQALMPDAVYEKVQAWQARAQAGEAVQFELHVPERHEHLQINYLPLRLDNGTLDGYVAMAQDITRQRKEELRLRDLSQRDALTGLLNRAGVHAWLELHLGEPAARAGVALLCIDLDRFKPVNDQHGHPVGDALLQQFAARLRGLVRPTDAVARLGGDEFAVLLSGVRAPAHVQAVADKILDAAHAPFQVGGLDLRIGASVGTALGLAPDEGWAELLARADAMLYEAKNAGRGRAVSAPPLPPVATPPDSHKDAP